MDSYFTDDQTLTLLKLVHTNDMQDKFNSNKKKHRKVWEEISQILEQQGIKKSAAKCQNRYENTKRSYNTIKRNHIGPEKPSYAYWDFWESILGEKKEMPFEGFEEFHEMYMQLKEARTSNDPEPDWEHWVKYEDYYKQKDQTMDLDHIPNDNFKYSHPIFTDRETDELLLIMGEPATRQIFIKHRKKHRIAWNYILKRLKKKGIHKTVDKIKNRFENLKRKYMHYKKNLKDSNDLPDWRYWNVFEEYMASRPNPTESDFMAEDSQEHVAVGLDDEIDDDEMETIVNESDFDETEKLTVQGNLLDAKRESDSHLTDNPLDVDKSQNSIFCRICLQTDQLSICGNMVNLFGPLNENIRINEALAVCVGLEIFQEQDSPFTNQICVDCINQLRATYNFRKLCWASENELKSSGFQLQHQKTDGKASDNPSSRVLRQRPVKTFSNYECLKESNTQQEVVSIPRFETIYEFVDTNSKHNDILLGESSKKTKDLVQNENENDLEPLNSQECPKRTGDQVEKLKSFKCSICMKKFPNIEYIKKHLAKIHSLISDSQTFKNYLELSNCDSDDELDDNVKCYICGKSYVKREYLKKHLKLIHNITDADYNVYERIDEENKTKKPLLCHSCGESFVLKHIFKKHIEHHERGSLLSCDYCDIKLVDKPALQRHMILHTGQRNHKCIFCAKGFFTRISQKRHERNVHTKEKSHICQYCDKKFVMWKFLERHLNTHTAEVVYECDQCDKKYLNKNHLRVHKFRHAKEPPFKCSICSKAYFDRSTLKKHNYVHIGNPYQCTSCDRTFDRRDKMNNHLQKVHGAEKLNDNQENGNQS